MTDSVRRHFRNIRVAGNIILSAVCFICRCPSTFLIDKSSILHNSGVFGECPNHWNSSQTYFYKQNAERLQINMCNSIFFSFQCKTNTSRASIWPVGVQRMEWQHGCAGEIWQHCVTFTGVINSQAIKTRWSAAEVTLMLSQPQRTQPLLESHFSLRTEEASSQKSSHQTSYIILKRVVPVLCFVSSLTVNVEHFWTNQLTLQNTARTESS